MGNHSNHAPQAITPRRHFWSASPAVLMTGALITSGCLSFAFSPSAIAIVPPSKANNSQPAQRKLNQSEPAKTAKAPVRSVLRLGSQGAEVTELQGILSLLGYYSGAADGSYSEATAIAVEKFQKAAGIGADGVAGAETWNRLLPASATAGSAQQPPATATARETSPSAPSQPPAKTAPSTPPKPAATAQAAPPEPKSTPEPNAAPANAPAKAPEVAMLPTLKLGMQGSAVAGLQERLRSLGFLKGAADGVFGAETDAAVKAAQRNFSLDPDGIVGTSTWIAILK
jgi:N-acetylmuramoyl-L-alanine amidase